MATVLFCQVNDALPLEGSGATRGMVSTTMAMVSKCIALGAKRLARGFNTIPLGVRGTSMVFEQLFLGLEVSAMSLRFIALDLMEVLMDSQSRRLTNMTSAATGALSFVTQAIPAGDELLVVPVHYWFAASFARKRGLGLWKVPWLRVSGIIWGGAGARLVANFGLGLIPVAGAFSNVATAVALTEVLARYLDGALDA